MNSILITEDNDFGEWIFAHKIKTVGVVFLRYHFSDVDKIINSIIKIIEKYNNKLSGSSLWTKPKCSKLWSSQPKVQLRIFLMRLTIIGFALIIDGLLCFNKSAANVP